MLVNLRDICAIAEQNNMAVGQFNAPSLEAVRAVIDAAEQTGYPVILAHAEAHEPYMPSAPAPRSACTSTIASTSPTCTVRLRWASTASCTTAPWSPTR